MPSAGEVSGAAPCLDPTYAVTERGRARPGARDPANPHWRQDDAGGLLRRFMDGCALARAQDGMEELIETLTEEGDPLEEGGLAQQVRTARVLPDLFDCCRKAGYLCWLA